MANKSVIDIDINDQQFKAFYQLFQQYQASLESMPDDWKKVDAAVNGTAAAIGAVGGAIAEHMAEGREHTEKVVDKINEAVDAMNQLNGASRQGNSELKSMASNAKKLGESIFGIGKFLLKMGALGAGAVGTGIYALDRLGQASVGNQRAARGLGVDVGQYRAFQLDFNRYLNAQQVLGNVANAQASFEGQMWLSRATGMNRSDVANVSPDVLAEKLAMKAHDWWTTTPAAKRQALFNISGLQSAFSFEDVRRLGNTPVSELTAAQGQYAQDRQALDISNKTNQAWYGFTRQISLAGSTLETYFTKKLTQATGPLGNFVTNLEKDAEILVNAVLTKDNMKAFSEGLNSLAKYLGSQDFLTDLKGFGSALSTLSHAVMDVARVIGKFFPSDEEKKGKANPYNWKHNWWGTDDYMGPDYWKKNPATPKGYVPPGDEAAARTSSGTIAPMPTAAQASQSLAALSARLGIPQNLLASVYQAESGAGKTLISPKGAVGPFQFMPGTAAQYGVTNPMDFTQSASGAGRYFKDLLNKYHGDISKALAAYNWGQGSAKDPRLDADIAKHGKDWLKYVPKETRDYISRVLGFMAAEASEKKRADQAAEAAKGKKADDEKLSKLLSMLSQRNSAPSVNVAVTNNTASRVAVSMNALG